MFLGKSNGGVQVDAMKDIYAWKLDTLLPWKYCMLITGYPVDAITDMPERGYPINTIEKYERHVWLKVGTQSMKHSMPEGGSHPDMSAWSGYN